MGSLGQKSGNGPGPSAKHKFVDREDNRMGLAWLGANLADFQQQSQIAVAASTLRKSVCQMPGCGKPKDDAIHDV
jgi:hypothetical protein